MCVFYCCAELYSESESMYYYFCLCLQLAKIDRSKEVEEEIALLEEQQRSLQLR